MFNTFFASFFGKQKESQSEDKKLDENELTVDDLENEYSVVRLVEINDDDGIDWLLVEKNEKNTSEKEAQKCMALVPWRLQDALPTKMNVTLMEDSWFLTPPECFINFNDGSVRLESSPLENLLIEHPSMSVYCDYKRNTSDGNNDIVIIDLNNQQVSFKHNKFLTLLAYITYLFFTLFRNLSPLVARNATKSPQTTDHKGFRLRCTLFKIAMPSYQKANPTVALSKESLRSAAIISCNF